MQQELTFSRKNPHKTVYTWDDIEEKFGGCHKPLSKQEASIYIKRAELQIKSGAYEDVGKVDEKNTEVYRKAYFKKMGWKYTPAGGNVKRKVKRKKITWNG